MALTKASEEAFSLSLRVHCSLSHLGAARQLVDFLLLGTQFQNVSVKSSGPQRRLFLSLHSGPSSVCLHWGLRLLDSTLLLGFSKY